MVIGPHFVLDGEGYSTADHQFPLKGWVSCYNIQKKITQVFREIAAIHKYIMF